ncbi:hypothetical protein Cri9333_0721 [Crinalium epipsammum PCC 9333]|uniref:Metallopeptidase n=1 Tax=Crinalium epipsammum PCC 9333 TaxID=1173022 RepID=K9VVQ9_9CYAN|nr:DUF4344 domain-containing metallopeptidase [Crinalium epipsammum]AFZ11649.1 hypothetical protein Cri9333_0721 [Crinalium epipsammum PCC 9333]
MFLIALQLCLTNNSVFAQKTNRVLFEKQNSKQQENNTLIIEPANNQKNIIVKEIAEPIFYAAVEGMNKKKGLKNLNLKVIARECHKENAFYDPQKKQIIICYELLYKYMKLGKKLAALSLTNLNTQEQRNAIEVITVNAGLAFVFQHELGHALIDVYKIPVFAAEEQVADSFAIINTINELYKEYPSFDKNFRSIISSKEEFVYIALLPIAAQYAVESARKEITSSHYANEHPLDIQRFYNLACLVYGSSPTSSIYQDYKQRLGSRASRCPNEYKQALENWKNVEKNAIQMDKEEVATPSISAPTF